MTCILITGGTGFIGSHTCSVLLKEGYKLIILDSLINSSSIVIDKLIKIQEVSKSDIAQKITFVNGDIRDEKCLERIFSETLSSGFQIKAVVHFAGLKAVGESVKTPLKYWDVNVSGTRNLLSIMDAFNCRNFVFSSSATIYGYPQKVPILESDPIKPINPYGYTKAAVEQILCDLSQSSPGHWRIASLRYFNPVGAHPSGLIGESPKGVPDNLFPFVSQVAIGKRSKLKIFGNDWPTKDGTCIRDYIHVMDLAEGHKDALETILKEEPQFLKLNLGCGKGYSVLDVVKAFEIASGEKIPYEFTFRRQGDVPSSIANPQLAEKKLKWKAKRNLEEICHDGWKWQLLNKDGYF